MKIRHDLNLKQTQKLSMTPELQQAIKLLQFNSIELNNYIEEQMQENPLLEVEKKEEKEEDSEIDWEEYIEKNDNKSYTNQYDPNKEEMRFENFVSYTQSLHEYLLEQLGMVRIDNELKTMAEYIIGSLDDNGYLKINLDRLSSQENLNIESLDEALEVVQGLDPAGVGASDLKECLLLQVKKDEEELVEKIIKDHLEDLGLNRVKKIAKSLDTSIEEIQESIDYIKTLEPKPGRSFNSNSLESVKYITPDAIIELVDGEYRITVTEEAGPKLHINNFYKSMIKGSKDETAKEFLTDRLNSAAWIIKSIQQRRDTIKKVVTSILKFQKDFFEEGDQALKPLTLQEVADDIEMHESTISRTTNGKYVQTPQGVFELKYFFTTGLNASGGDKSTTSIKSIIEELVSEEDETKPYSDQKISDQLKEKGIKISRRTVAKYRDELGIPSSTRRKRYS